MLHSGVLHKNAYTERHTHSLIPPCLSAYHSPKTATHMYAGWIIYSVALEASSAVTQADNKASPQWKC